MLNFSAAACSEQDTDRLTSACSLAGWQQSRHGEVDASYHAATHTHPHATQRPRCPTCTSEGLPSSVMRASPFFTISAAAASTRRSADCGVWEQARQACWPAVQGEQASACSERTNERVRPGLGWGLAGCLTASTRWSRGEVAAEGQLLEQRQLPEHVWAPQAASYAAWCTAKHVRPTSWLRHGYPPRPPPSLTSGSTMFCRSARQISWILWMNALGVILAWTMNE